MLGLDDTLLLPDGVSLVEGAVEDTARGERFAANAAAAIILEGSGSSLERAADRLARQWELPAERARQDVLQFAWQLNRLFLANVAPARVRRARGWARLAVRRLPTGSLPPLASSRRAVDTRSAPRAVLSAARGLAAPAILISTLVTLVAAHLALLAGSIQLGLPVAIGSATGAAFVLHESGHAAALVGVPSALVLSGARAFVLHPPLPAGRRLFVALAGPAVTTTIGVGAVSIGEAVGIQAIVVAGIPLAAHALSVTMLGSDGRTACGL